MQRFLAGFLTATALWGLLAALHFAELLPLGDGGEGIDPGAAGPDAGIVEVPDPDPARRRRSRRRRPAPGRDVSGTGSSGDDLGSPDPHALDLAGEGGEGLLTHSQIEEAIDGAFSRIRRCLVLAAGDDPVAGTLTFGLRIEGSGRVSRVNVSGPRAVSTGEAGTCLQTTMRSIRFPSFDGPDMFVRYPITLD